jgi:hypothetical protein
MWEEKKKKYLESKIGDYIYDLGLGKKFLNRT